MPRCGNGGREAVSRCFAVSVAVAVAPSRIGNGLTVIQAPAGCGKTALAMQFADELDFSVAWVALDSACASPEVFAERLARVLAGPAFPAPVTAARLSDLFSYLGNALQERVDASEQPLLIVLDNVQELGAEADASAMLEWLVVALPEDAELLLCSREPFQAPTVNRRLVAGEAVLVGKEALAFTLDEIRALVELREATASPEQVLEASAGWAMGVLALLGGSARAASGLGDAWRNYLTQELWGPLPADLRELLQPLGLCETVSSGPRDRAAGGRRLGPRPPLARGERLPRRITGRGGGAAEPAAAGVPAARIQHDGAGKVPRRRDHRHQARKRGRRPGRRHRTGARLR